MNRVFEKRISMFTGHFGSGKTEVAVNYAEKLSQLSSKTAIVDLDIVNPYFRTADAKAELEAKGIWVILPMYANTNVDVPAVPAEVYALFQKKEYRIVFDIGGDDLGARVISRYKDEILQDDYELYFVINTRRPMTDTVQKIEDMIHSIEGASRIKVTGLVNNTNLLQATTAEVILEGHEIIEKVSQKLNIPIKFISGFRSQLETLKDKTDIEFLYMDKLIKLPWE